MAKLVASSTVAHLPIVDAESLKGILYGLSAALLYALMGLLIHLCPTDLPSSELLFVRAVVGILVLSTTLRSHVSNLFSKAALPVWGRSFFGAASIACFYISLRLTSFANANVLTDFAPIFVPIFSWIVLKTRPKHLEILGFIVLSAGLVGMYTPEIAPLSGPALSVGLLGAITGAIAYILLGQTAKKFNKTDIVFCQAISILICSLLLPGGPWKPFGVSAFPFIFGSALIGLFAQLTLTASYKYLNATVATALTLTVCIWGILIEAMMNRSFPSLTAIAIYSVILTGIYLIQYPSLKKST